MKDLQLPRKRACQAKAGTSGAKRLRIKESKNPSNLFTGLIQGGKQAAEVWKKNHDAHQQSDSGEVCFALAFESVFGYQKQRKASFPPSRK